MYDTLFKIVNVFHKQKLVILFEIMKREKSVN